VETREALKKIETEKIEFKEEVQMLVAKVETIAAAPITKKEQAIEIVAAVQTFEKKTETKVTKAEVKTAVKTEEKSETIAAQIIEEAEKEEKNVPEKIQTEKKSKTKTEEKKEETKVATKTETKSTKKNISSNIDKIMDKVDASVKDVSKNLIVKNIIITDAMIGEVSLDTYANQKFYIPKDIYLGNNLIDNRKIYNVSLASYIAKDPINIKDNKLQDININKQRLLLEIEALKNGT
jgi:chemotaxis protein histidine kinase CheA